MVCYSEFKQVTLQETCIIFPQNRKQITELTRHVWLSYKYMFEHWKKKTKTNKLTLYIINRQGTKYSLCSDAIIIALEDKLCLVCSLFDAILSQGWNLIAILNSDCSWEFQHVLICHHSMSYLRHRIHFKAKIWAVIIKSRNITFTRFSYKDNFER